jgi:hypothetical protein
MKNEKSRPETAVYVAFEDYVPLDPSEPEKNLMAAVLKSAFDDLKKQGAPYREARDYILSNDTRYIYSFVNVCLHLGLCPKTIRALMGLNGNFVVSEIIASHYNSSQNNH